MYEVYGFFDVMIRAWMTPEQRSLFYKALENDNNILEKQDFIVYEIDYLWSPIFQKKPELDDKKLNKYHPDRLDQFQSKETDEKLSTELQNCGLVLKDVIIDDERIVERIYYFKNSQCTETKFLYTYFVKINVVWSVKNSKRNLMNLQGV